MSVNRFPGTTVVERAFNASSPGRERRDAAGAFIGRSNQGPLEPTPVTSWAQFTSLFGTQYTELHNAVHDFYASGGRQAFIVRIPGVDGVASSLDVFDAGQASPPVGSPTPLFTVTALNPGVWGDRLHLVVRTRDAANKRFDVALFNVPTGVTFDPSKTNSEYVVDRWSDVSLVPGDSRNLYDVANQPSTAGSPLVQFAGQEYDATADPATWLMPSTVPGGSQFDGGVDGSYGGAYSNETAYLAAMQLLDDVPGPLVLNAPGMHTAAIIRSLTEAAANRGDVFVVVDTAANLAPSAAVTYANTDLGLNALGVSVPSYAAVFYPWVYLPVVGSTSSGRSTLRAPGGSVVGAMLRTDSNIGPWRAPAGLEVGQLGRAVATERQLKSTDLAVLNDGNVNAIRNVTGAGVTIMGARTMKRFGKDRYINVRRNVMHIGASVAALTEFAVFRNNDQRLWVQIEEQVAAFLGAVWQRGGLKGETANEAFFAKCDEENNSPASVDEGVVNIDIGVALLVPAEFINITISQFEGGTNVTSGV